MSNVFTIQEVENRDILVPINTPGIERLLKVGARVKFRGDLKEGQSYGGLTLLKGMGDTITLNGKGKELTVEEVSGVLLFFIESEGYLYSKEMLEGVYLN